MRLDKIRLLMHKYIFFQFKSLVSHQGLTQEAIQMFLSQYCPPRSCSIFKEEIFVPIGEARTLFVAAVWKPDITEHNNKLAPCRLVTDVYVPD